MQLARNENQSKKILINYLDIFNEYTMGKSCKGTFFAFVVKQQMIEFIGIVVNRAINKCSVRAIKARQSIKCRLLKAAYNAAR